MKKLILFLLLLGVSSINSYSQGLTNIQFSFGVNSTSPRIGYYNLYVLPNSELVSTDLDHNSGESSNYGILLSWQLVKDKPWYIKSGLSFTKMSFSSTVTYVNDGNGYFQNNIQKINQFDLPILIGYKKSVADFDFGIDAGVIKTIWVDSKIDQHTTFQTPDSNPDFKQLSINNSGSTEFLDKYSFYIAPIVQWNFGKFSGVSLQPFYRIQLNKEGLIYTNISGSIRQIGVNLGYNVRL